MKILLISDPHGKLPDLSGYEYDLVILAGDVCPHHPHPRVFAKDYEDHKFQYDWINTKFIKWVNTLKSKLVMIAGNHDYVFQHRDFYGDAEKFRQLSSKIVYLKDDFAIVDGIKIWGSPWTPFFFNWAFNFPEDFPNSTEAPKALYEQIPDDVDIVVTHGPMYNVLDLVREEMVIPSGATGKPITFVKEDRCGSRELKDRLKELPKLQLHVCGHIHCGYGIALPSKELNFTSVNCSILNNGYKSVQAPIIYEYKR